MQKYKINRKLVSVICSHCKNSFLKPESEYKRNLSLNRDNYCDRVCKGKSLVNLSIRNPSVKRGKRPPGYGNPFRYYIKTSKARFKDSNITLDDLKNQWEFQKGICPYSGIELILNSHTNKIKNPIYLASLDRIDSSTGYIKENIQFVSQCINYMKNTMSHEETLTVCKLITKHWINDI